MKILTISGSAQRASSNDQLLMSFAKMFKQHSFTHVGELMDFPLFTPEGDKQPPAIVLSFKEKLRIADLVIISLPEYVHNLPAVLKNGLEWITSSGELYDKKVIAITYTPQAPRGEKAMLSLLWSLQALSAKIIAELPLYKSELTITKEGTLVGNASVEAIKAVFEFIS
jgi:NAD(P)H-dependent FMN reductase